MSISQAMETAVAGLGANSRAVTRVAENIANSGTTGYKRSFENFVTLSAGSASGKSVTTQTGNTIGNSSNLSSSDSGTDLAISGSGFFVVSKVPNPTNQTDFMLTRAGSFTADEEGNLVNAAGYYLAGFEADITGSVGATDRTSFGSLSTVNVSDKGITTTPTTGGTVSGNLSSYDTGTGQAVDPIVSTMSFVNALGAKEEMRLSWQASNTTDNLWTLTVAGADGTVYGTVETEFADSGLTPGAPLSYVGTQDAGLAAPSAFAIDPATGVITLTVDNGAVPQTLTLGLGAAGTYDGMTQFAGDDTPQTFSMDGRAVAQMMSTEFDDKGAVYGVYDDGSRVKLFEVPIAMVDSPTGLETKTGNAWALSKDSGSLRLYGSGETPAGDIVSGMLEDSNVDIATELTDMIRIQRAYSSNTKTITTADDMLQEAVSMKR
ncbi:flagellar hook protein FlgE [Paracoccus sp. ME4]|uniref:flagellar hook protein FlgE n=1 Tax=Paracoccus sp. ME4 TaxID=3138066 RepID=UPI00398A5921